MAETQAPQESEGREMVLPDTIEMTPDELDDLAQLGVTATKLLADHCDIVEVDKAFDCIEELVGKVNRIFDLAEKMEIARRKGLSNIEASPPSS